MKSQRRAAPSLTRRTRVRMEFTAHPTLAGGIAITQDKKLTALTVLLKERFGAEGARLGAEWLAGLAVEQSQSLMLRRPEEDGGPDAA